MPKKVTETPSNTKTQGIAFALPVDEVVGLGELKVKKED